MPASDESTRTLRYWFEVEALTAPDAEAHDERGDSFVITYFRGGALPWPKKLLPLPHKHFVRFGIIPRKAYEAELLSFLRTDELQREDSGAYTEHKAFTYLGVFEVDEAGLPQAGTIEMAEFASAFASRRGGRKGVGFDRYKQTISEIFDAACEKAKEKEEKVDEAFLRWLLDRTLVELDWIPTEIEQAPIAIIRTAAIKNDEGSQLNPTITPVNGYFLSDIRKVIADRVAGHPTGLIEPYLASPEENRRADCTKSEVIERTLATERLPDGRWPAKHDLTLMQQVAVNEAFASLRQSGIFSINGPPGTGKTTLLMDIIAGVLVERAKVLSEFDDPASAFTKRWEVPYQGMTWPTAIFALDQRLHGYSIVVTSSNNGAVDNITRELPNVTKLDKPYQEFDYFRPLATELINRAATEDEEEEEEEIRPEPIEAWGLISAPLGKKKNRNIFVNMLQEKNTSKSDGDQRPLAAHNIFRLIEEAAPSTNWKQARDEFQAALAEVKRFKQEIASIGILEDCARELLSSARATETEVGRLSEMLRALTSKQDRLREELKDAGAAVTDATAETPNLLHTRPGFFARLFNTASFRKWQTASTAALAVQKGYKAKQRAIESAIKICQQELSDLPKQIEHLRSESREKRNEANAIHAKSRSAKGNGYIGFDELRRMPAGDQQQVLPQTNEALQKARAALFIKAVALHRAFVVSTGYFTRNLKRALEMIDDKRPELKPILEEAAPHLWETLFLLVPVISTTFASFSNTFRHLGAGRIGWVFIDEAGQAVPQHAVGALYRARRAVIVGDPLQVEPVITFDKAADARLLEQHGVPGRHQSTATSVQVLADLANPFGASINPDTWVGAPLRVQRRCVEPMFSISNAIAYRGAMIMGRDKVEQERLLTLGDPENGIAARPLLGPSRWFDVQGIAGNRQNYIPEQGEIALDIVREFIARGWVDQHKYLGLPALYVVSPFKSVAQEFRSLLVCTRMQWASQAPKRTFDKWVKASVGTVHTFQGKQRETVVLLLGGAKDGAIKWAAGSPNILNVAVTRAERRLYVIGDHTRWMRLDLAACMVQRLEFEPSQPTTASQALKEKLFEN